MPSNYLYLAVQPLIHLDDDFYGGTTEQVLTLYPDKNFATEFFPDEVDKYIALFQNRSKHLTGGHVKEYKIFQEKTLDGRVIVQVVQNVG
jgi:hypothetical protein